VERLNDSLVSIKKTDLNFTTRQQHNIILGAAKGKDKKGLFSEWKK
jgi:hypothetical protein